MIINRQSIMNGISGECAKVKCNENREHNSVVCDGMDEKRSATNARKLGPLRTVSWNENVEESDLEIPGTPRTPRTSTTPGIDNQRDKET